MPSKDPEKNRKYVRDHYYRHKERVLAKVRLVNKKANADRKAWITALKAECGCAHCGERDPIVLEFHHPNDDKTQPVSRLTGHSWKKLKAEVAKCIILCANCHLREHARVAQLAEAPDLGSGGWSFEHSHGHQIRRIAAQWRATGLENRASRKG